MQGYPPQLVNVISGFLSNRETYLSFNGFESKAFQLNHGLPQGSPLSPLLYQLYNNSLLHIADTHKHSTSLGFVDDVVLITAAVNQHELCSKVQTLADAQINWAKKHSAIFDAQKSKWMVLQPTSSAHMHTIKFGDRKGLVPVSQTKWLGVTIDSGLTFKRHRDDVITKGKKSLRH